MQEIMDIMDQIEYGFPDNEGHNILLDNPTKYDEEFYDFYYLMTPEELLAKKCGVCWDQVELARKLFADQGTATKTYFICTYDGNNLPSHTFLTYQDQNKYYWFEHSWGIYKGIHEYASEKELLLDVKSKFLASHKTDPQSYTFVYEYQKPKFGISCHEFYRYCESQKLIKLNEPLYFYHVVNKDADLSLGLLSPQYMYDHQLYDLFDKSVAKYKERIVSDWQISKYQSYLPEDLTREDILDALNIFRGIYGSSHIYFFKYPPYQELGPKIKELLKIKDIYRININDEEVQRTIEDIFYGYDLSNSGNKMLTKEYYEKVTESEYFTKYDDTLTMNFSTLNHISIAFINDYCPISFLEKCQEEK